MTFKTLGKVFVVLLFAALAGLAVYIAIPLDNSVVNQSEKQLAEKFTLEQKVGQLFIVGFDGTALTPQTEEALRAIKPGGVLLLQKNIENAEQLKKLTGRLQALSKEYSGLPLFIAVDQEGGPVSRIEFLTEKTAQSAIANSEQAYEVGLNKGKELNELGVNLNLSPLLDRVGLGDFIFERGFHDDLSKAGETARALIKGQKDAGILTAVKHFPGYGNIAFNPEEELAVLNSVPDISLFLSAAQAKPEMAMAANVVYRDIDSELPFTFSAKGIGLLKEKLGDEVLVVSDDLAQNSLLKNFSLEKIVGLPVKAGVDMLIFSGWRSPVEPAVLMLRQMIRDNEASQEQIDRAFARIRAVKEKMIQ